MHPPRVVIGLFGIDQHEVGAIAISRLLRDAGMEVVYVGRYQTPATLVRVAHDEDADVIGLSCHSWEYLDYAPELMALIEREGLDVSVILGGSVITPTDAAQMKSAGIAETFGPDATPEAIVDAIRNLAEARQRRVQHPPKERKP